MSKKRQANFYNMTMFAFSRSILLMSVWARNVMTYTNFMKEGIKFLIFTTPVGLHCYNFGIKAALNQLLEVEKDLIDIGAILKKVNPCKFTEIINKTYIILIMAYGHRSRAPIIRENKL